MAKTLKDSWFHGKFCYHEFRSEVYLKEYHERLGFNGLGYVHYNKFAQSFMSIASYSSPAATFDKRAERLSQGEKVRIPWIIEFEKSQPRRIIDAIDVYRALCDFGIHQDDIISWITPSGSIYMAVNPDIYPCVGEAADLCRRNQYITERLIAMLGLTSVDMAHYSPQRIIRTFNSRYPKHGGYVVPIRANQLGFVGYHVKKLTERPVDLKEFVLPCQEAPDWTSFVFAEPRDHHSENCSRTGQARRNCIDYFMSHPEAIHSGIRNSVLVSMGIAAHHDDETYSMDRVIQTAEQIEGMTTKEVHAPLKSLQRRNTKFSCKRVQEYLSNSNLDSQSICQGCPFLEQIKAIKRAEEERTDFMVYAEHLLTMYAHKWSQKDILAYFELSKRGLFQGKVLDLTRADKRLIRSLQLQMNSDGRVLFDRKKGYRLPLLFIHVAQRMKGVRLRQFLLLLSKSYRAVRSGYLTRLSQESIMKIFDINERAYYYLLKDFKSWGLITRFTNTWKITFGISKLVRFEKPKKLQSNSNEKPKKLAVTSLLLQGFLEVACAASPSPISISNVEMLRARPPD